MIKFKNGDVIELLEVEQTEEFSDGKIYNYSHVRIDFPVQPDDEPENWWAVDAIPCDESGHIIGENLQGSPTYTNTFKRNLSND